MKVHNPEELSWFKRFMIRTRGYAYVGHQRRPGWRDSLPFYAFKCPEHGIVEDYPHGYGGNLSCPICSRRKYSGIRD
jgi:hypothetical protein